MGGIKRVYWDIETSPNIVFSWRAGYRLNISHESIIKERAIICLCYKYEGKSKVHSLEWNKGDDKEIVQQFSKVILDADELVAHNGDKFDLRWFNTRNLIHDLPPIPESKTIDTLKIARKHFYLNSNKLDYLGSLLLDEGKVDAPYSLWKRVCLDNEPSAMKQMVHYCKKDVELLERVYEKLSAYSTPKTHTGVLNGMDRWTCPHCGSDVVFLSKTRTTAKGMIQRQMKCSECSRYYQIANKVYRDYLVERDNDERS